MCNNRRGRMAGMAKRHPALRVYLWSCLLLLWLLTYVSPRGARTWGMYTFFFLIWLPAISYFVMMAIADRGRFGLRTLLIVVTLAAVTLGIACYFADIVPVAK